MVVTMVYSKAGIDYRAAGGSIMCGGGGSEMETSGAIFLNEPTCTSVLSTAVGQFTSFWKCAPVDDPLSSFPQETRCMLGGNFQAEMIYSGKSTFCHI